MLGGQRLEQFGRKAMRRVHVGRFGPRHGHTAAFLHLVEDPLNAVQPAVDGGEEIALFLLDDARHALGRFQQLGIGLPRHFGHDRHQLVQKRLAHAHLPAVEHGAPQEPLDDVFFLVRPGINVLVDGERASAHVIGNPPQPPAVVVARHVLYVTHLARGFDDRSQDVNMKIGLDSLHHRSGALQSHAGVDILARQRPQIVGRSPDAVELREHQVPDLDFLALLGMKEDLAAWAADAVRPLARRPGGPEVVILPHTLNAAGGHFHLVVPDVVSLVVVEIDRHA
jgi:hypothetical protein